jgi:hypothetical protein
LLNKGSIYCENFSNTIGIAEPVNTITNIAFIIVSIMLFRLYIKNKLKAYDIFALIVLLFFIGIGSGIWHFTQSPIGELLDIIPILLFMLVFLASFLKRFVDAKTPYIVLSIFLFILLSYPAQFLFREEPLKTSGGYLPAILVLILMSLYLIKKKIEVSKIFSIASLIFMVSISFRSLDFIVCSRFSTGSHFVWHILNAVALYLLVKSIIIYKTSLFKH